MYCIILGKDCIEEKCKIWDSCLLKKTLEDGPETQSYLEDHTVQEIAKDYIEFLQSILGSEKMTDFDFFVEECFWSDKIGNTTLSDDLEQKRIDAMRMAEQMYAEILLGNFVPLSSADIAQEIVEWAKAKKYPLLGEEELELFWKERFGLDLYQQQPTSEFELNLRAKFLHANELAQNLFANKSKIKRSII